MSLYEHHLTTLLATVPITRYGAVPCNTATRQDLMLLMKMGIRNALATLNLDLDLLGNPEVAEWRPNEPQAEIFVFFEQPWRHAEIMSRLNLHGIMINGQKVTFRVSTRESKTLIDIVAFRYPDEYGYRACSNAAKYEKVRLGYLAAPSRRLLLNKTGASLEQARREKDQQHSPSVSRPSPSTQTSTCAALPLLQTHWPHVPHRTDRTH
jgi:hypothetical protein